MAISHLALTPELATILLIKASPDLSPPQNETSQCVVPKGPTNNFAELRRRVEDHNVPPLILPLQLERQATYATSINVTHGTIEHLYSGELGRLKSLRNSAA